MGKITLNDFLSQYELVGWIVEIRREYVRKDKDGKVLLSRWSKWEQYWTHKVYKTKEDAERAVNGKEGNYWCSTEIRYRPIYSKIDTPSGK